MSIKINIGEDVLDNAKFVACKVDDTYMRKRVYALGIAANATAKYLTENGLKTLSNHSLYKSAVFAKEIEIADIYANNARFDVRVTFNDTSFTIPKLHVKYDIKPEAYIVVRFDNSLKDIEFLGFIPEKELTYDKNGEEYYTYPLDILKPFEDFIPYAENLKVTHKTYSEQEHDNILSLCVGIIDEQASEADKIYFIKHVAECTVCRDTFCDINDFDDILSQLKNYRELLNDSTLSVLSGNKKEVDQAAIAHMALVENASEDFLINEQPDSDEDTLQPQNETLTAGAAAGAAAVAGAAIAAGGAEEAADAALEPLVLDLYDNEQQTLREEKNSENTASTNLKEDDEPELLLETPDYSDGEDKINTALTGNNTSLSINEDEDGFTLEIKDDDTEADSAGASAAQDILTADNTKSDEDDTPFIFEDPSNESFDDLNASIDAFASEPVDKPFLLEEDEETLPETDTQMPEENTYTADDLSSEQLQPLELKEDNEPTTSSDENTSIDFDLDAITNLENLDDEITLNLDEISDNAKEQITSQADAPAPAPTPEPVLDEPAEQPNDITLTEEDLINIDADPIALNEDIEELSAPDETATLTDEPVHQEEVPQLESADFETDILSGDLDEIDALADEHLTEEDDAMLESVGEETDLLSGELDETDALAGEAIIKEDEQILENVPPETDLLSGDLDEIDALADEHIIEEDDAMLESVGTETDLLSGDLDENEEHIEQLNSVNDNLSDNLSALKEADSLDLEDLETLDSIEPAEELQQENHIESNIDSDDMLIADDDILTEENVEDEWPASSHPQEPVELKYDDLNDDETFKIQNDNKNDDINSDVFDLNKQEPVMESLDDDSEQHVADFDFPDYNYENITLEEQPENSVNETAELNQQEEQNDTKQEHNMQEEQPQQQDTDTDDEELQGLLDDDLLALLSDEDQANTSDNEENSSTQQQVNEENSVEQQTPDATISDDTIDAQEENGEIENLFDEQEAPQDGEQVELDISQEPMSAEAVKKTKKLAIAGALIALLAIGGVAGGYYMYQKNTAAANNDSADTAQDNQVFDFKNNAVQGGEEEEDTSSAAVSQDINKSMTNSFSDKPAAISITKLSWQVSEKLAVEPSVKEYLQTAGKNIQLNLQNDLANSADVAFNNSVKVSFEIAPDNTMKGIQVLESSGSDKIDATITKSIKNTLKYISVPKLQNYKSDYFLTLIINF